MSSPLDGLKAFLETAKTEATETRDAAQQVLDEISAVHTWICTLIDNNATEPKPANGQNSINKLNALEGTIPALSDAIFDVDDELKELA